MTGDAQYITISAVFRSPPPFYASPESGSIGGTVLLILSRGVGLDNCSNLRFGYYIPSLNLGTVNNDSKQLIIYHFVSP